MAVHQNSNAPKFDKTAQTILVPDMFPVHMELLAEAIRSCGYQVEVLHNNGQTVLDTGLKYLNNDMCYPAICSVGQQLHAVTSGQYDLEKVALLQFQTGGGCRASNYVMLLKKALRSLNLEHIPVLSIGFNSVGKKSPTGFGLTPTMCLRVLAALTYGDALMLLSNQTRPYEVHTGDTDALTERWSSKLRAEMHRTHIGLSNLKNNLQQIAKDFHSIETQRKKKVKVGIVGEVYVKFSPFGNNQLEQFLRTQDCEYMLPGALGFIHYCMSNTAVDWSLYGGSRIKRNIGLFLEGIIEKYEVALSSSMKPFSEFVVPASFSQMRKKGEQLLHRGVKMGEGWYLPAEMVELAENGYDNIICAQPFGCLPNHIVGKGVVRPFRELFPQANICPIDYDASSSAVNQENRIKLMLAIARDKAGLGHHKSTLAAEGNG